MPRSLFALALSLLGLTLIATAVPTPSPDGLAIVDLLSGPAPLIDLDLLVSLLGPDQCSANNALVGVTVNILLPGIRICACIEVLAQDHHNRACPQCVPHSRSICGSGKCGCQCDVGYYATPQGACVPKTNCPYPNSLTSNSDGTTTCTCLAPEFKPDGAGGCKCASPYAPDGNGGCCLPPSPHARSMRAKKSKLTLDSNYEKSDEYRCPNGETACPVGTGDGWECLDTTSSLDSCGGCLSSGGVNCLTLNGVMGVACVDSRCQISSCFPGWRYVRGGKCVRNSQ